jgi:hypothetical protein
MKYKIYLSLCVMIAALACKDEPSGPETDCDLHDLYIQDHHFVTAAKVFDIRTDPPTEIKNDTIEYKLYYQWAFHHDDDPVPVPYNEYFIDTIAILDQSTVRVHFFESEVSRIYSFTRNDCGMELTSAEGPLHLELIHGGDEMIEQRFAIYDHRKKRVTIDTLSFKLDTFSFIEYRLGAFASYEDIIAQFAADHPGEYDTVAIERVQNKTKE